IGADAFTDGEFEGLTDGVADGSGNVLSGFADACQIKVALVNRADFDVGREIVGVGKHEAREEFILLEVAGQEDEFRTKPPGYGAGHRGVNAELARFVRGRSDDAALFTADGDGFATQSGISGLFYGGEESVSVQMDDGAWKRHGEISIFEF